MIALNEPNAYAREVAFTLPLDSDPLTGLTGYTFTLGEVQIKTPGQAWADAPLVQIVEKGYGRFCVRLTPSQVTVAGDVFLRATVSGAQYYFGSDVIGQLGGDIAEVSSTGSVSFFLPLATDPIGGAPLTGHTFVTGEVRVCLPDNGYVDADVAQVEEIGFGGYKLNLTSAQTLKRGKVFVYASVAGYQRWEGYCTILDAQAFGDGLDDDEGQPPVVPVPVPIVYGDPEYVNQYALALGRLPQQFRSGTLFYGEVSTPAPSLGEILGVYVPPVIEYDVVVPTIEDTTVANHLAQGLNRLPQQFRSGTLIYDLPVTTTPQEVAGVYVPPVIEYAIELPIIVDEGTSAHLASALNRLPHQFRSGSLFYGGATLNSILDGGL